MLPSELTNTIQQFIMYVHRNEAHFIYIYVYHTSVFEADDIYKNPPPNVISPIFVGNFYFALGLHSTHDYADCWGALSDPQLPTTTSNVSSARLIHGWVASAGCPPKKILATPVGGQGPVPTVYPNPRRSSRETRRSSRLSDYV